MASSCLLEGAEPVIDIHQHTNYSGRTDEELVAHQRRMGVTKTVLLPAGSKYVIESRGGMNGSPFLRTLAQCNEKRAACSRKRPKSREETPKEGSGNAWRYRTATTYTAMHKVQGQSPALLPRFAAIGADRALPGTSNGSRAGK